MSTRTRARITGGIALMATGCFVVGASAPAHAYQFERQLAKGKGWENGSGWCASTNASPEFGDEPRAYGCLEARGDILQIADGRKDSRRAGLRWSTDYGRSGLCVNKEGADFKVTKYGSLNKMEVVRVGGGRVCNKNFKEGSRVTIRVGSCNASKVNCLKLKNWAWGDAVTRRT